MTYLLGDREVRIFAVPGRVPAEDPSYEIAFAARVGRCYELAARFLTEVSGAVLVHGTIGDARPPLAHAWVELPDGDVFEPTSGHRMAADEFATYFRPTPGVRYSREAAYTAMLRYEHWGPWGEGGDSVGPAD